jgi:hypothetical protein
VSALREKKALTYLAILVFERTGLCADFFPYLLEKPTDYEKHRPRSTRITSLRRRYQHQHNLDLYLEENGNSTPCFVISKYANNFTFA